MVFRRLFPLTAALLLALAAGVSVPAMATDVIPYTDAAARQLDRAAKSVEQPSLIGSDPTAQLRAFVSYTDAVYKKAGYSYELSLQRFLRDYQQNNGVPEMNNVAMGLGYTYANISEFKDRGADLTAVFKPETVKLIEAALGGDVERARQDKAKSDAEAALRQAEFDAQRAEQEARQRAEQQRQDRLAAERKAQTAARESARKAEMGASAVSAKSSAQGRYQRLGGVPSSYLQIRISDGIATIAADHRQQTARGELVCELPPTPLTLTSTRPGQVHGAADVRGCKIDVTVKGDQVGLFVIGRPCSALCSQRGNVHMSWDGGSYRQVGKQ